ncbi:hypothetical protein DER45DRAFT_307438 [Fusarium avenaceum]|nr:hypothetical protein DER45DRAFT_307438 [Fusarium avenaceum]
MAGITERVRKGLRESAQSTSQDVYKSLRQKSSASVMLGKRTYSQLNNTKEEGERPSTQELGLGALHLGNKIRRTSPSIPDKPSTWIEQSGGENVMKVGLLARNIQPGNKDIRHKMRDKDDRDHRISRNHEDNYRQLHHDDRSRLLKPPALSTPGHYTISKDYTGGEEVRRSHLLDIYGRKCGAKRGGQVLEIQQEEETLKNWLRTPRMDPTNCQPSIRAETKETRQQRGVRKKNARFEIPSERNLGKIDHLFSESTDENEIKELKQQKRLLRNRQAALDSRQRKKQQAERLDDETKQYTALISDMEEEISELKRRNE